MMVDIPDVITSANCGEDRLRGLGVAGGQNLPFSIDFDRRPYNTLALPCECVIIDTGIAYEAEACCPTACTAFGSFNNCCRRLRM